MVCGLFYCRFCRYIIIVVNVIELMVYRCLSSNVWNQNHDNAYPSSQNWTARYWSSGIIKLNIVNNFSLVTISGQIMPWGSGKTWTTHFINQMKGVLSSLQGQIELQDIQACWITIFDIAKGSANYSSNAGCHNCKSGYTGRNTWKLHIDHSMNTPKP